MAIEKAMRETTHIRIYRRLQAVQLRAKGKSYKEISEITGFAKRWASKLVCDFIKVGIDEFARMKWTSHSQNLATEAESQLLSQFKKAAEAGQIIEVSEIRKAYDEQIGKESSVPTIYKVLKRHDWRKIMPRSKHPKKASNEAIEASKKLSSGTMN